MILNIDDLIRQDLSQGLPLVEEPYRELAEKYNLSVSDLLEKINKMKSENKIRRFGVIVNHRSLGLNQNAMCVWNIPDAQVDELGFQIANRYSFVTLCYRRKRLNSKWPFNFYCMIHGKNREEVFSQVDILNKNENLSDYESDVLFSVKCFKQRGANYLSSRLKELDKQVLNELQNGISIEKFPFRKIAERNGVAEEVIVQKIRSWLKDGTLTRFGPMYNVEKFGGVFTLVALKVPLEKFEEVAKIVNSYDEVAHNYERENLYNMWFVLATETQSDTDRVLKEIFERTGYEPLPLPKLEEYYLNLQFKV